MNYLKFRGLARVLFFSSFVLIAAFLAFLTTVVLLIILWQTGNEDLMIPVAVSGGILIILGFFQAILSARTACQLCQSYILRESKCSKNPKARPLFGSYRLKVAVTTIFAGQFRCPYCGEEFNIWAKPPQVTPIHQGSSMTRKAGKSLPTKKR